MRSTRKFTLLIAPVAVLLAAATVLSGGGSDPMKQVKIDAGGARAAAEGFAGKKAQGAIVTGPFDGALHNSYRVANESTELWVDALDGSVLQMVIKDVTPGTGSAMSARAAESAARDFFARHAVAAPSTPPVSRLIDRGAFQTWLITWQARSGRALAPDMQEVELDAATGQVLRMVNDRRPFKAAPDPVVSLSEATAVARVSAGLAEAAVEDSALRITFDDLGAQQLVWSIVLTQPREDGVVEGAFVDVNAITGDATVVGRG